MTLDTTNLHDQGAGRRSARLRMRAAWMYYVEEMTQSAIAEALGVGRVTVVRLLADARALNEVRVSLRRDLAELPRLELALERRFGLDQVILAPHSLPGVDPSAAIGAATGQLISGLLRPGMKIGVGWGRTLLNTLTFVEEATLPGLAVVSLLGGVSAVRQYNPAEFAWQFSRLFQADCFLIAAPALVDSPETKRALIERCGLKPVFDMGAALDVAVVSVGSVTDTATTFQFDYLTQEDQQSLLDRGAVGDVLFNFYDINGRLVDHPINQRVMSIGVDQLRSAPVRVLTSGGAEKIDALIGGLELLKPTIFVTDEQTASALLQHPAAQRPVDRAAG